VTASAALTLGSRRPALVDLPGPSEEDEARRAARLRIAAASASLQSRRSAPIDPVNVTAGAVSAWLRVASGTITGSGYSALPDALDAANPAVQSTDARRPTAATSANGLPILACSSQAMSLPLTAARNGTTQWGFGCWVKQTGGGASAWVITSIDSAGSAGASARKFLAQPSTGGVTNVGMFVFNATSTTARGAQKTGVLTANTWMFLTYELNLGSGGSEATRAVITLNGAVQGLTFSDALGTPGAMPTSMPSPTGSIGLFAQNLSTGANGFGGNIGPNIYLFGSAMPGATEGLLTASARTALMNFEAPT
jgi:hypothetical protein